MPVDIKCQWCDRLIPKDKEVVVIKPALFKADGTFEYDETQTIAVYDPECWEEFVKGISS